MGMLLHERTLLRETVTVDPHLSREHLAALWGTAPGIALGHAFDGVLWGQLENGELRFSCDFNPHWGARFRTETLIDLRIFNTERELRLWRTENGHRAARLSEKSGEKVFAHDIGYCLVHQPDKLSGLTENEFVQLDGLAGQQHFPPGTPVPQKLWVRSYYRADDTGILRVFEHRALGLAGKDKSNA